MDLKEKFAHGLSAEQFLDEMNSDQRALHETHARRAEVDEFRSRLEDPPRPLKIIVITEHWCGDSAAILPVVLKMLKNKDIDIHFLYRDENPELMDLYLTNGSRSIPKFIILDEGYNELASWGPRPKVVQEIFEQNREKIRSGELEKSEIIKRIRNFYSKDRGKTIAEEFSTLLLNAGK